MITVIHYSNKDPDVHFDTSNNMEKRILNKIKSTGYKVERSSSEDWPGQDNPKYAVHHWEAKR